MKTQLVDLKRNKKIRVEEDTQFVLDLSKLKSGSCVVELIFDKEGVDVELIGVYKLNEGNNLDLSTTTIHKVPNTSCVTKVKGVLGDRSVSNYIGKIVIEKRAQQTSSFLKDDVLVIGDGTKSHSEPILEIEANEVKASHGATAGRIDEGQLYYLMSRGLTEDESKELIIEGFLEDLIKEIKDEKVQSYIRDHIK